RPTRMTMAGPRICGSIKPPFVTIFTLKTERTARRLQRFPAGGPPGFITHYNYSFNFTQELAISAEIKIRRIVIPRMG
ncbi:MAG: hypothetical protein NTV99_08015, partial [Deltaproteobacteria bacterium]|nr:hypothetical protein [Deltaproteobacteria bacterium]